MKYLLAIPYNLWKLYIGLIFVVTLILFYPFFLIVLSKPKWRTLTFPMNVFWSRVVRILCFYAVEIVGTDHRQKTPHIICANHTSYLDIFFLYSVLPEYRFLFMGKSEILSYPLVKTFFRNLNIPVYRSNRLKAAKSFIQAKNAMEHGWSIIIFPEGGIPEETPYLIPFKNGAFQLAKTAKVGIQSLTFCNNYYLFSDPEDITGKAMPGLARIVLHPTINQGTVDEKSVDELKIMVYDQINSCLPQKNH